MKRKWLTTALTIAVESAQIVSPWTGQQHACQTDVSNVHLHCSLHTCVKGCCKHSKDESSLLQWKQCLWCFTYMVKFSICPFFCYLLEVHFILIDILCKYIHC